MKESKKAAELKRSLLEKENKLEKNALKYIEIQTECLFMKKLLREATVVPLTDKIVINMDEFEKHIDEILSIVK